MTRVLKILSIFFVALCFHQAATAQRQSIHFPREFHCNVGFFDLTERQTGDNAIGSAFYFRMKRLEQTNPEKCGAAKKEFEEGEAARKKYDQSNTTSRALREASSSLSSQMSRQNTEASRRKEAWQRKKVLEREQRIRDQAKYKAKIKKRQAEMIKKRRAEIRKVMSQENYDRLMATEERCRKIRNNPNSTAKCS